ncbi:MAG: Maf family protein [Leptolyngbya sp. IPPAS B-1204]|uniref:Nucleoside triphosphate pyrophosphatase n=1 Tax=Leptolyngbya sp. NK1-12 TaxID=2547451 RepID=A0AA97AM82_9CYAN|nr:nucleoside triphosphate pyrophosphatase [Leptolyngbya sp. NK1-12]MBF2047704.1 septum formation inhibitor Maf [Elainella sp. C42_A2020_010]RNJ65048.1 MAG: septum formation inhibitor Maf [Leptolyngbya sp. IPPAS B-1204]WNZ25472.1 septum formation inhibitor Maf [Leptolyngbya sp. NK1-12]
MGIPSFVLASASPARLRLLREAGIEPIVHPSHFDEAQVQLASPQDLVQTLADGKATAVAAEFNGALILGCDSVLAFQGEIYGKPANPREAIERWQQMRGQTGQLFTGHVLIDQVQQRKLVQCQVTEVEFALVSERQIEAYVASGEPLQCAGGFALEGRGGLFIEKINGCHSNVIGLSLPLLRQMLAELSYDVTDFWLRP